MSKANKVKSYVIYRSILSGFEKDEIDELKAIIDNCKEYGMDGHEQVTIIIRKVLARIGIEQGDEELLSLLGNYMAIGFKKDDGINEVEIFIFGAKKVVSGSVAIQWEEGTDEEGEFYRIPYIMVEEEAK
jgi:hypothetical protein